MQKYLNNAVKQTLQNEVVDVVIQQQKQVFEQLVYNSYIPHTYIRRQSLIQSNRNGYSIVYSQNRQTHSISIENVVKVNPNIIIDNDTVKSKNAGKRLIELLETGGEYSYDFPYEKSGNGGWVLASYTKPKPITITTKKMLNQSSSLKQSFKLGMEVRGVKCFK